MNTKSNLLKSIFISLILVMGVNNAWAATIFNCGIEVNETWYKGTGTINSKHWLEDKTDFSNKDFGVLTSIKLGGHYDTWDNSQEDYCGWNPNNGITITIKNGSTQKDQFRLSCFHSAKDGNNNIWETMGTINECSDEESSTYGRYTHDISKYTAGAYTIEAKWMSPSSISNTATAKFTIPGFTTTSKSQAFDNTQVNNSSSKTISFGTHYGTALKTSNCSISGTNASEFSVTSINESGVTVQFKPTSAGDKKATLTITDAHSKKCTITLSGNAQSPTPSITISTTQQYLQIGEDKLTLTINYTNIPEGHCYRVKVGDGYYNGNAKGENNDHVSISGNGSVAFTTYSTLPGGTQSIVVELWKSNPFGATSTKSNAINVTVEQGFQVSIYTRIGSTNTPTGTISPTEHIGKTITATAMPGYAFTGWTSNTDNITFEDASAPSTLVYAKSGGDIYANYTKENCVYFINTSNWNDIYVYAWNGGGEQKNAEWPGVAMTKTDEKIDGHDVYKYCEPYEKIIFNNNSSNQTGDIIWEDGVTYYPNSGLIKMHGNFTGDWNTTEAFAFSKDGKTATLTLSINNAKTYNFGMRIGKDDNWTSNGSSFTRADNSKAITSGNGNCKFNADITGEYTFTWTFATNTLTITYPQLVTYTVTFNMNGHGTQIEQIEVNKDSKITKPNDPTATGYTFGGWYKESGCTNKYDFNTAVTGDFTLYAKWTPKTYDITYKDQNNANFSSTHEADYPKQHTYATDTQLKGAGKMGYTFLGWHTDAACTNKVTILGATAYTADITLYAKWEIRNLYIHADFVNWEGIQVEPEFKNNSVVYTYTGILEEDASSYNNEHTIWDGGHHFHYLYSLEGIEKPETQKIAYNYKNVDAEHISYTQDLIDAVHLTDDNNPTIQFGLTKKSRVTITLTLVSDIEKTDDKATQPDVAIVAIPCNTITLDQTGARTQGTVTSVEVPNGDPMPAITGNGALPTPQIGYTFMGYFDQIDGKGTQYYNADGTSAHVWDKVGEATLYAYFKAAEITINLNASTFEPGTASVTATATLTPKPVGTPSICWELLYNDDTPVEEHAPTQTGNNQVQFNINDLATGTYQIKATLHEGAGCEGTIISQATQVFTITSDHTITIKYVDENGQTIKASTTQSAHVSSLTEITAPPIIGYTFKEWEAGDGVSIKDATDGKKNTATIEYNAYYDGYLKAIYTKNSNIIYFYNTLGWENVYVYFYSGDYWYNKSGTGTQSSWYSSSYKGYAQMTRMDESNIWYVDATGKDTKFLVFGKDEQVKYDWFSDTEVIRRGDYNSSLPMFVPIADQTPTELNKYTKEGKDCVTKYYNKGYWMNYPENTGYTLDLFNHHNDNDPARYFIYPYSKNTIFPLQLEVEINAENVVEGAKKIWFRIHRNDGKNFGGHATNFPRVNPTTTGGFIEENNYKVELITPIAGTYTFTLDYRYNEKTKDYQYHIEVDYPAKVGDYRILYRDEAETNWSGNTKPVGWYHPSRVIKKGEDRKDIISFYINKDVERSLSYQTIKSINNETGAITWNTTEVQFSTIDWSQITKSGVYNFVFVQDGKGISVENDIVPYTGNYYIRTDAMGGGWEDYKTNSENRMTYSSFSESDANSFGEQFSHYAVKWCEAGTNVKFTIANDYSHCISDTLAQDIIPLGNLTDEGTLLNNDIYDANIRFMWNRKTNKISRAYVGPAGDKQSQFLMLQSCSEFKDAAGNDLNPAEGDILDKEKNIYAARFTDTQNWIYERTIQVKPRTRVKLYASYPNGYHIYIENNTGWKDVALYAFKNDGGEPLGTWPGVQPTRTVKIGDKTYYDFPVNKYVFGSTLIFNNNVKENGQQTSNYTDFATVGDYYLTASSNNQLSFVKNVSTTVEATAQYFRGAYAEGSCDNENTVQILGGEGETWNTIRVIYDFKTNRLIAAWMPNNNEIDIERSIESDVMIIRDHQDAAQCITFANDNSKLTDVKTVYGVMRFNRWILNNRGGEKNLNIESCTKVVDNQTVYDQETTNKNHPVLDSNKQKSQYERALYFISFPFDVHLSDVFGFGTYGQHWIIEYYDGLKRAREGYWIDSDPNWKYVTNPTDFVLKAYEGYILCLNLGKMAYDNTDFWAHNISQVELFFPSFTTMDKISKIEVTMPSLGEEYLCTINRGEGTEGDRRVKDSYWRCIGVPSYANYSNVLKDEEGNDIRWQTSYKTFPFLYAWNMTDNTLTPQSTSNFPFKTMHAYLVQNGGEIHWSAVSATPEPASIVARKEAPSNNYEWKITLTRNEQVEDQAFIRLSNDEKVTTEFDFNQDLSKEFNYGRSDIYTLIGYEKAAANSLPLSEQTTLIPLGLSIEYNGDYTIAMPGRMENIGVTLVDNQTGTRTNLSAGMEYTLTLNKGDYNNRFFIEISPVQQVPTDIEYVTGDSNGKDTVRKVLIDNILYIVRDGQMFDARGARVK